MSGIRKLMNKFQNLKSINKIIIFKDLDAFFKVKLIFHEYYFTKRK